ncbi:MAG TPA: hypothetical protein V6C96_02890 [Vampirovibrionales bacterium]
MKTSAVIMNSSVVFMNAPPKSTARDFKRSREGLKGAEQKDLGLQPVTKDQTSQENDLLDPRIKDLEMAKTPEGQKKLAQRIWGDMLQ